MKKILFFLFLILIKTLDSGSLRIVLSQELESIKMKPITGFKFEGDDRPRAFGIFIVRHFRDYRIFTWKNNIAPKLQKITIESQDEGMWGVIREISGDSLNDDSYLILSLDQSKKISSKLLNRSEFEKENDFKMYCEQLELYKMDTKNF